MPNHQFYSSLHLIKLKRGKGWECSYHKTAIMPVLIGKDGFAPELACPLCIAEEYGGAETATIPYATHVKGPEDCEMPDCCQTAAHKCSVCGKRVCIIDCYDDRPGTPCVDCGVSGLPDTEEDETNFPTVSVDADGWTVGVERD